MLGNLAILFQDFEKSRSVCISNSDKSPLGGGAWSLSSCINSQTRAVKALEDTGINFPPYRR